MYALKSLFDGILQLQSLRKGEGLEKDVDETKLANTFDPDESKYEKSNKKKQKLLNGKSLSVYSL